MGCRNHVLLKSSEIPEFRNIRNQVLLKRSEIPEFRNMLAILFRIILKSEKKINFITIEKYAF
jgi:hypothetical protein